MHFDPVTAVMFIRSQQRILCALKKWLDTNIPQENLKKKRQYFADLPFEILHKYGHQIGRRLRD